MTGELHRGPVVLRAWAPWCGSCRTQMPIVDQVASSSGVAVVGVRVDADPDLVSRLGVRSVPTLVALRDGREVGRLVGSQSRPAIESLFAAADGEEVEVHRRLPQSLVVSRVVAGAVIGVAGAVLGSLVLGLVGVALLAWAVVGMVRR